MVGGFLAAVGRFGPAGLVPLVEEFAGEFEDESSGEGGRLLALALDDLDVASLDSGEKVAEQGQVQVFLKALAVGFDDDREVGHLADGLEQVLGAQTLEPERGSTPGLGSRQEQSATCVLAEAEAEQGTIAQFFEDQLLGGFGVQVAEQVARRLVRAWQADQDAVIAVQSCDD